MGGENEKIIRMQDALIKGYQKQISILEKENKHLNKMLDMQNEVIETQKQELEIYERFMEKVWGFDSDAEINVVWTYISYLRKKLKQIGSQANIKAVRNVGYVLGDKND